MGVVDADDFGRGVLETWRGHLDGVFVAWLLPSQDDAGVSNRMVWLGDVSPAALRW